MFTIRRLPLVVAVAGITSGCERAPSASTEVKADLQATSSQGPAASAIGTLSDSPRRAILGSGNAGFVPKFLSPQIIGNSEIFEAGGKVTVGGTDNTCCRLQVQDDFAGAGIMVNLHQVDPTGDINIEFTQSGPPSVLLGNIGVIRSGGGPQRFVVVGAGKNPQNLPLTLAEDGANVGIGTANPGSTLDVNGNANVSGNLTVQGTKSSVATLSDGRRVLLYAIESPKNWFEDFGTAQLRDGKAWVSLEGIFAETVNTEGPYHVFLTPNGDCRGLYVSERRPDAFLVRELRGGRSNVSFDYRIVAPRRGFETVRLPSLP